jgi:hypothetical protein
MMLSDVVAAVRRPISSRVAVRRSTALMGVLFIGLGGVWLEVKSSNSTSVATVNTNVGNAVNRALGGDLQPGDSMTITIHHSGTTTTVPSHVSPSTSVGATTTAPTTSESLPTATSPTTSTPGSASSTSPPTTGSTSTATTAAGHSATTSPPGG